MPLRQLKNPWAVGVIVFSVICAAVYLFAPLFSLPIFGFSTSLDYVKVFYASARYMDMVTFLLPLIGAVGAVCCVLAKTPGPHILSLAFSALPAMFLAYFVVSVCRYPDIITSGAEKVSMLMIVGWGAWLALAAAVLALAAAFVVVVKDFREMKKSSR